MTIGRLLEACGYTRTDAPPVLKAADPERFVKVSIEPMPGGGVAFCYTVNAVTPAAARRLTHLLGGDRRQRKRGLRLMRQRSLMERGRRAAFVIADEVDAFTPTDRPLGEVYE